MAKKEVFEEKGLTSLEEKFCQAFGDPESKTYGKGGKSAVVAGYSESTARSASWKALRRSHVKKRLKEIYNASDFSVGRVLTNLMHDRMLAEKKEDISSMVRADELCGKHLRMFSERFITGPEVEDEARTEAQVKLDKEFAQWCLEREMRRDGPDIHKIG